MSTKKHGKTPRQATVGPIEKSTGKSILGRLRDHPEDRGRGPKKGHGGRPPEKFKALCRELACSGAEVASRVLGNPDHPAYLGALKWATEHGYGAPQRSVDVTSGGKSLADLLASHDDDPDGTEGG